MAKRVKSGKNVKTVRKRRGGNDDVEKLKKLMGGEGEGGLEQIVKKPMQGGKRRGSRRRKSGCRSTKRR
jgi:hypothetical protein